jgi:glucoamylase
MRGAAPGGPGIAPTWCSSAKELVGCSLGASRLWFTIGGGIINEVYYPRVDLPQIRDLGFIVADGKGFWTEVKRLQRHVIALGAPGTPAVRILHRHERFELTLRVVPCTHRDVLLVEVVLNGEEGLKPYALLAPHLGGGGGSNRAEVVRYRGRTMLWAEGGPYGAALGAVTERHRDAWQRASAGYVGENDGWQDFARHRAMTWEHGVAGPGNVALTGELPRYAVLALGLGGSAEAAATLALTALFEPFDVSWERQIRHWTQWHASSAAFAPPPEDLPSLCEEQLRTSTMVLRAHQDKTYLGAMVSSLSVPWGNTRQERGGYHLVRPRELAECAGALLAVGATREAGNTLRYLLATQHEDGHWSESQWLGGEIHAHGEEHLTETAFPVLLAVMLDERGALDGIEVADMIQRALSFIVRHGPANGRRWQDGAGINTFTLGVCCAALVAGAAYLPPPGRELALAIADYWNVRLEDWACARDTPLAARHGIAGYYTRIPARGERFLVDAARDVRIGVDFLQLVRFGLRRPDDPVILSSVRLADELLKVRTPSGVSWRRHSNDSYGEHDDGRAFDGYGRGRAWPLLTGERGHYEVARGKDPLPYLVAMARMASSGGMLPEQVWDGAPIPERGLVPGRPTGAAMPLARAHAEFIKLVASRGLGHAFDRPQAVWERYRGERPHVMRVIWCEQAPVTELPEGSVLLMALPEPGVFRWGVDGWQETREQGTQGNPLGLHILEMDTPGMRAGHHVDFTYRLERGGLWAGRDFRVSVVAR